MPNRNEKLAFHRLAIIILSGFCLGLVIQVRSDRNVKEWQEEYIREVEKAYDDYALKHGDKTPPYPPIKPIKSVFSFD